MRHYNDKPILKKKYNLFNLLLDYKFYCFIILVDIIKCFIPFIFDFKNLILCIKKYIGKKIIFINIVSFKIILIIFRIKLINI